VMVTSRAMTRNSGSERTTAGYGGTRPWPTGLAGIWRRLGASY